MSNGTPVGIDLGTTNSVVAYAQGGRPQVLTTPSGATLIPSVVSFAPNGQTLAGSAARAARTQDPENTVFSVKRLMGRPFDADEVRRAAERFAFKLERGPDQSVLVRTRGGAHSLPELSAMVLREVRRVAETALGGSIGPAVITVPANFNELQRTGTKLAGQLAEIDVVRILNEPTAAALAYGYGRSSRERVAVYDFGGGTFDITLLELKNNVFEVLGTAGDTFLGGDDIDLALAELLADGASDALQFDARADRRAFERLRASAEQAKIDLSTLESTQIRVPNIGRGPGDRPLEFRTRLTRSDFEQVARPFVTRTVEVCAEALKFAGLSAGDFSTVILVGGSSQLPLVRRAMQDFFKVAPHTSMPPDTVVALGAAMLAESLGKKSGRATGAHAAIASATAETAPLANAGFSASVGAPPPAGATSGEPAGTDEQRAIEVDPEPTSTGLNAAGQGMVTAETPALSPTAGAVGVTGRVGSAPMFEGISAGPPPMRPRTATEPLGVVRTTASSPPRDAPPGTPSGPMPPPRMRTRTITHASAAAPPPAPMSADARAPAEGSRSSIAPVTTNDLSWQVPTRVDGATASEAPFARSTGGGTIPNLAAAPAPRPELPVVMPSGGMDPPKGGVGAAGSSYSATDLPALAPPGGGAELPALFGSVTGTDLPALPPMARGDTDHTGLPALPSEQVGSQIPTVPSIGGSVLGPIRKLEEESGQEGVTTLKRISTLISDTSEGPGLPTAAPRGASLPTPAMPLSTTGLPAIHAPAGAASVGRRTASLPAVAPPPPPVVAPPALLGSSGPSMPSAPAGGFDPSFGADPSILVSMNSLTGDSVLTALPAGLADPSSPGFAPPPPIEGGGAISTMPFGAAPSIPTPMPALPPARPMEPVRPPPIQAPIQPPPLASPTGSPQRITPAQPISVVRTQTMPAAIDAPRGSVAAPLLLDVTPQSLRVETVSGLSQLVIARNSTIPLEQTREFATAYDNQQDVRIRIAQGEQTRFGENQPLGELELMGLRPAPRGEVKILVTFELDADGTLQVRARDAATGAQTVARINLLTLPAPTQPAVAPGTPRA
jgi:molecular chaperone DnaK